MADLALTWRNGNGDLLFSDHELVLDDSLTTAIVISLFTDLRVDGERGWWGDSFNSDSSFQMGSKLWTLSREKQLGRVLEDAQRYATEALQWLIDDGEVQGYVVSATNPQNGILLLTIDVTLLDGSKAQRTFTAQWSSS